MVSGGHAYLTALRSVLARASEEQPWTAVCLRCLSFRPSLLGADRTRARGRS
jgi:hypothetical protein